MPSPRTLRIFALFACCTVFPLDAGQTPPTFSFGGKGLSVGMPKPEALRLLSACCKLVPPAEEEVEAKPAPPGGLLGHMILPKEEKSKAFLGDIFFSEGRVAKITRPLADDVDTNNDDLIGFARAVKRALANEAGDAEKPAFVLVRHERMAGAESDVVFIQFRDGRGIEITVGTLDKPNAMTGKRDFANLEETLEPAR